MSDEQIIKILTEYIPRKKSIAIKETHAIRNEYICGNPNGPVSNEGCPDDNPLCNCPAQEIAPRKEYIVSIYELLLINDESVQQEAKAQIGISEYAVVRSVDGSSVPEIIEFFQTYFEATQYVRGLSFEYNEPSDEELDELLLATKECTKIEEVLGEEWLGCIWEDPNSSLSCNCPNVGERFMEYLRYNRTVATFWNTPDYVPLYSIAQRGLLFAQKIKISISGDLNIRPGNVIVIKIDGENDEEVENQRDYTLTGTQRNAKFNGRWMVHSITHRLTGVKNHKMDVILIRDSLPGLQETQE